MDYRVHYDRLIDRARHRTIDGYSERHHVVPKCLGGGNERSNIVRLTPEEHFVAHELLVKLHPGDRRLTWALMRMSGAGGRKAYGWLRRKFGEQISAAQRGRKRPASVGANIRAAQIGRVLGPPSQQHRDRIRAAKLGKKRAPFTPQALANMRIGQLGRTKSAETREKIAAAHRGRVCTDEHRQRMREGWARRAERLAVAS